MTEKERREDEALKNCIQEAYGLSDEQLLAELDELEASLSDDEFVGAEDRIYARIKEMEAEREATSVSDEDAAASAEIPASNPTPIRKISKKKKWLVIGIAAALVVGAGVNTIGENNYFLREREKEQGIILNSGKNIQKNSSLQEAYYEAELELGVSILKLHYLPEDLLFEELLVDSSKAIFVFNYNDNKIYFIQRVKNTERSLGIASDRMDSMNSIYNEWLSQEIVIEENVLNSKDVEYSININYKDINYRLMGILPKNEIEEIAKKLNY